MRVFEARYEEGVLRPTEPLALRAGEMVNLIVVRRPDHRRWDPGRLADAAGIDEDLALAEAGLAEWAERLDEEDRR